MKKKILYILLLLIILIVGYSGLRAYSAYQERNQSKWFTEVNDWSAETSQATSTRQPESQPQYTTSTYRNEEFGFDFTYPIGEAEQSWDDPVIGTTSPMVAFCNGGAVVMCQTQGLLYIEKNESVFGTTAFKQRNSNQSFYGYMKTTSKIIEDRNIQINGVPAVLTFESEIKPVEVISTTSPITSTSTIEETYLWIQFEHKNTLFTVIIPDATSKIGGRISLSGSRITQMLDDPKSFASMFTKTFNFTEGGI